MYRIAAALIGMTPAIYVIIALLATLVTGNRPNGAHAQAPVIGQGGAAPCMPIVSRGSHAFGGCPQPTRDPVTCGAMSALIGSDVVGRIDLEADYVPGIQCVVTFATPWIVQPVCVITSNGNKITTISVSTTQFGVQVSANVEKVSWICLGTPPP